MSRVYRIVNKILCFVLICAVLATGGFAVYLTHIHASVTITFGDQPKQEVAVADAIDMASIVMPIPQRKPRNH